MSLESRRVVSRGSDARPLPSGRWQVFVGRNKAEGDAVVAIPLAGWGRAVVEHVTLMSTAPSTVILNTWQDEFEVSLGLYAICDRVKETWPPCAAVKLGGRFEEWEVARGADVGARPFLIVERACSCWFGRLFEEHTIRLVRQETPPLVFGLVKTPDRLGHDLRGPEPVCLNHRTSAPTVRVNMNVKSA